MFGVVVIAAVALLVTYLYRQLHFKRFRQYGQIPQVEPSLILGHLKKLDEIIKRGPSNRHPDYIFAEMLKELPQSPLMFVDLRPVDRPMAMIATHDLAEQVSRASKSFPTSIPKSDLRYMHPLIGKTSLLQAHGDEWRALRKRYNPAFAPQHIMSLMPCIADKTFLFVERLNTLAQRGQAFEMVTLATNLAFDIIGAVTMDVDLEAQPADASKQGELVRLYVDLSRTYWDGKANWPWWMTPQTQLKRRRHSKRIGELLSEIIRRKHAESRMTGDNQAKSIVSLSLSDSEVLTDQLVAETSDQIKTFLLAGHDTTSIALSWCLYLLSRTPHALVAVRRELDYVLGPDTDLGYVRARLVSPEGLELIRRLKYLSAVLKETLRLYPPAATARYAKPGTGFTVRMPNGEDHCLDGMIIYNAEYQIQRDPAVYGDSAEHFVPERWLGGAEGSEGEDDTSRIPPGAFRAFERGPRGCIGQDFAMIELRTIVAMVARRFDFVKVGLGELVLDTKSKPVLDEYGVGMAKSEVYNCRQVTSKPVDGMTMVVRAR